ncbi:MAG: hypothetical protein UGF89_00775 [Acutalibacteraceae bacterium]|nr:hypothetical protein [Acutalibacteraceae bacterium]
MRNNNSFRFSLQFNNETEENKRAGEFLESLGNRKSIVVVAAINEYLQNHPVENGCVKVEVSSAITLDSVTELIEKIVSSKLENVVIANPEASLAEKEELKDEITADVSAMLDNLDLFA